MPDFTQEILEWQVHRNSSQAFFEIVIVVRTICLLLQWNYNIDIFIFYLLLYKNNYNFFLNRF